MVKLLQVDGKSSMVCEQTSMIAQGLGEVTDLEAWIVHHPEVIDPKMKIVTTQFNRWASEEGSALERPDIVGLSDSGELVVIELKRVKDKTVHLQALTYAALASSFTLDVLAQEHAAWYNKQFQPTDRMTEVQAKEELESFLEVDDEFDEELAFALPKIMLVAPEFPAQVLTTVQWLNEVAPDLTIECHQYHLFTVPTGETVANLVVSFNRAFPVEDISQLRLRAQSPRVTAAKEQQKTRRRRSVSRILDHDLIPHGASLDFDPSGQVNQESVSTLKAWLNQDPARQKFTWNSHSQKPFKWGVEPEQEWTATRLSNELFKRAGVPRGNFAATTAWFYQGENLALVAERASSDLEI